MRWLRQRPGELAQVKGVDAAHPKAGVTRSWLLHGGGDADVVIVDTPAGVANGILYDLVRQCDILLIPVMPSPIDIHAVSHFVQELMKVGKVQSQGKQVGIIANRFRARSRVLDYGRPSTISRLWNRGSAFMNCARRGR
jgi:chromosome partitioning protein